MSAEYLDHPRPLAFAHRGGAARQPENSLLAFENAARLGYAYLETDARSTADGKLIAFHDADLNRATDRTGQVSRLPWREVAVHFVGLTEALIEAARLGIVHRDLKPANVLVDRFGSAHLADFGLATGATLPESQTLLRSTAAMISPSTAWVASSSPAIRTLPRSSGGGWVSPTFAEQSHGVSR